MEIPRSLRVVSIVLIVLGIIRIIAGTLVLFGLQDAFEQNRDLIKLVIFENFITGPLILISGLLLLKGKAIGRFLLIISVVTSWIVIYVISKELSIGTMVIFSIIIVTLFLEDSIKQYFSNKV